jgi:hypothetical protein
LGPFEEISILDDSLFRWMEGAVLIFFWESDQSMSDEFFFNLNWLSSLRGYDLIFLGVKFRPNLHNQQLH